MYSFSAHQEIFFLEIFAGCTASQPTKKIFFGKIYSCENIFASINHPASIISSCINKSFIMPKAYFVQLLDTMGIYSVFHNFSCSSSQSFIVILRSSTWRRSYTEKRSVIWRRHVKSHAKIFLQAKFFSDSDQCLPCR